MMRSAPFFVFCLPLFAGCLTAIGAPPATAPAAGAPATGPSAPAKTVDVATLDQLRAALGLAGHTPHTHIRLTADIESTDPGLYIRGEGTDLDGNGHRLGYRNSYNGTAGGCGFNVYPDLSKPEKADPNAQNVIFCNRAGSEQARETAAGGSVGSATKPEFFEPAPVRYWDQPRPDVTFSEMRHIFTPAQNITIHDVTFATDDPKAFAALNVEWARNVMIERVKFVYHSTLPVVGTGAQECDHVTFRDCDFGEWACAFNTARDSAVVNCRNGGVSLEEDCHGITVADSSLYVIFVADATCGDVTITGNTIQNNHDQAKNWGAIAIREISGNNVIENNTLLDGTASEGTLWASHLVPGGTLMVKGNKGKSFTTPAVSAGVTEVGNTWSKGK